VVLCDRFTDASFAYQGAGRGFDLEVLSILERWVQTVPAVTALNDVKNLRQPNLTLWFDLDPAVAAERLAGARVPDKFESQPQAFFEKVAGGYAQRLAQSPERFARIDAALERHKVWQQITAVMVRRGWLSIMVASR
jgi:dTMP kinase